MHWFRAVSISAIAVVVIPQPAASLTVDAAGESHCVVIVVDQKPDGEFVLSSPVCFEDLGSAFRLASDASVRPERVMEEGKRASALMAQPFTTFTLGTHFDGYNGTGSSITVVGGSCTGGWWNTGGAWANRISSSYNGCYRLRHYDNPNKTGTWVDTTGVGQTDNLPPIMNNRTESVAYYGS
jgi:hypothetical protein